MTYKVSVETVYGTSAFEIVGRIVIPTQWVMWTKLELPDGQIVDFPPAFKFTEKE
jgi:hypothetical protein